MEKDLSFKVVAEEEEEEDMVVLELAVHVKEETEEVEDAVGDEGVGEILYFEER